MQQSPEAIIKRFRRAALELRKEHEDPAKARAFLIRAGVAEQDPSSPGAIRLVKELR